MIIMFDNVRVNKDFFKSLFRNVFYSGILLAILYVYFIYYKQNFTISTLDMVTVTMIASIIMILINKVLPSYVITEK